MAAPKLRAKGRAALRRPIGMVAVAALTSVALGACGSSKPAYCSDRTNLENSIKGLPGLASSSGISGLQSQIGKIQSSASALVNSAKSDFPNETSAIKSSVAGLSSAVKSVPSNPSAQQIVPVATSATSVVSSVKSFTNATSSKCG
jgi:hypothetical protein